MDHNELLIRDLIELVNQYQSGLLTAHETLCSGLVICSKVIDPTPNTIDANTGLRYPKAK